ncbi:MAG: DUF2948 family protein [Hyphomonadaceae bacterium]
MTLLRLIAADLADLDVISAAVQDGLMRMGEIVYDAKTRRFSALLQRFRWERAHERGPYERVRAVLSFDGVEAVRTRRLRRDQPDALAALLSLKFEAAEEPPAGVARLVLAGGGEIALDVECLDVTLVDIGPAWPTPRRPDHERA